jgi:hypothetical protein
MKFGKKFVPTETFHCATTISTKRMQRLELQAAASSVREQLTRLLNKDTQLLIFWCLHVTHRECNASIRSQFEMTTDKPPLPVCLFVSVIFLLISSIVFRPLSFLPVFLPNWTNCFRPVIKQILEQTLLYFSFSESIQTNGAAVPSNTALASVRP